MKPIGLFNLFYLSLAFVLGACSDATEAVPENSQIMSANEESASEIEEGRVVFKNFRDNQLSHMNKFNLVAELDELGDKAHHSRQLESGHRVFLAKGTSVKNLCRSYFGTYNYSHQGPKLDPQYGLKNIEFGILIDETNHSSPTYILTQDYGHGCNEDVVSTETETQFFLSSFSKIRMTEAVVTLNENERVHFAERPRKRPI